ncbi:hypothetical protein KSX_71510 [Ktedonospora formicarum]|uniref:Uncharacterized protein n=1 Tax=Ktedonospora formicarum TaxID=2778364 RepID=A0A8J3MWS9_9CHLR|nr:hypothetical protein KSX_71510 [Ktedonospora formicarum]
MKEHALEVNQSNMSLSALLQILCHMRELLQEQMKWLGNVPITANTYTNALRASPSLGCAGGVSAVDRAATIDSYR